MSFPENDLWLAVDCSDEERLMGGADGVGRGGDDFGLASEWSDEERLMGGVDGVGRGDDGDGGFLADLAHHRRRKGVMVLDKDGNGRPRG